MTGTTTTKVIIDILKEEMSLPDTYGSDSKGNDIPSIIARDQNILLGSTPELQITVGYVDGKIIASNSVPDLDASPPQERQTVLRLENIQIDLQSRNTDARDKNWEVIAALTSNYSKEMQMENKFKIFRVPRSFVNSGAGEGGSNINRYSIVIACHVWYNKSKDLDYYDTFPAEAYTEEGSVRTKIAEFNAEDWED